MDIRYKLYKKDLTTDSITLYLESEDNQVIIYVIFQNDKNYHIALELPENAEFSLKML